MYWFSAGLNLNAQDDYAKWLEKQKESYQQYLAREDSEFLNFLEAEWKAFQIENGKPFDAVPKPKVFPEYKPKTDEIIETKIIEFDGPV